MLKSAKFHTKNLPGLVLGSGLLSLFCFFTKASATTLSFSTLLGGFYSDYGSSISVDISGNCYVTGETTSSDFPTIVGAYDISHDGCADAFVTKLNASGSSLVFSTFLGGSSEDNSFFLSLDGSGNSYVTGYTLSNNFPTTNSAYDTSQSGYSDSFVTKLNASGSSLVFSTFLGGSISDAGHSLSLDESENCYLTGEIQSSDYPATSGAYDTSHNGYYDAFVTKLNSSGSSLVFSTFLGGSISDAGYSLSLDGNENCYVAGLTYSSNYPATGGAYDTSFNGYANHHDAFVTKLNPSGSLLVFSTFLGESFDNYCSSLSLDESGNCYVSGSTQSNSFPTTVGAFNTAYNGGFSDTFVTKLNSTGSSLEFSTFLGGNEFDYSESLSLDGSGNVFVTGQTQSSNFPTAGSAFDTSHNGNWDVFVTKLNSGGNSLNFSTYLGGSHEDHSNSLSVDGSGNCYITGITLSINFPTTSGAFDTSFSGGNMLDNDAFVTKFDFFTEIKEQNNFAKDFHLEQNFPNPFNPNTTISYELAKTNDVKLEVFNTKGELVRTLVSEKQNKGSHASNWNGKDERGNSVSSGVYFYKLTAGNYTQTNKMILLK